MARAFYSAVLLVLAVGLFASSCRREADETVKQNVADHGLPGVERDCGVGNAATTAAPAPAPAAIDYDRLAAALVRQLGSGEFADEVAARVALHLASSGSASSGVAEGRSCSKDASVAPGISGRGRLPSVAGGEELIHELTPPEVEDVVAPSHTVWKVDVSGEEPYRGNRYAPVTLVVWSDFLSPFCKRLEETLAQVVEHYGERIRVVWKSQPLSGNKHSRTAALAGCAAHVQGRFWPYHDLMFDLGARFKDKDLDKHARSIGLDFGRLKKGMESAVCVRRLAVDSEGAERVGAAGAPSVFVNGRKVVGALPFDSLKELIDEELATAANLEVSGVPRDKLYEKIVAEGEVFSALSREVAVFAAPAPSKGADGAVISLTVFGDFECPFSARFSKTVEALMTEYEGRIRLEFRHYPLPFHADAHFAAQASLAAEEQGKFWEMYDYLFESRKATRRRIDWVARRIGLDRKRFKADVDSGAFSEDVNEHIEEGRLAGVEATPTVFINGRRYQGQDRSYKKLKQVIETEILSAGASDDN